MGISAGKPEHLQEKAGSRIRLGCVENLNPSGPLVTMTNLSSSREKLHRVFAGLILAFLIFVMDVLGFILGPNQYFYDLFFRMRGPHAPSSRIVIAAIDEKTLGRLGKWPIHRRYYTELLGRLKPAEVVGLDIILAEPSEDDAGLAEAISEHGRVVLTTYITPQRAIVRPSSSLAGYTTGHIHIEPGMDGVTREVYHTLICNGGVLPSFSSAIVNALSGHTPPRSGMISHHSRKHPSGSIVQADPMLINYYGPSGTFRHISLVDILDGREASADFFNRKIVLVGVTAPGIVGDVLTPFRERRERMSGVESQAHILNNLLDGSFIRPVEDIVLWPAIAVVITTCLLFFARFTAGRLVWMWLLSLLVSNVALFGLFAWWSLWIPAASVYAALTAASVAAYIFKLQEMQRSLAGSERDWAESFNTIEDAIAICDDQCQIVKTNRAAAERLDPFLCAQIKQRCIRLQELHAASGHGTPTPDGAVLEPLAAEELFDRERELYYELRSLPRTSRAGTFDGTVHVARDITQRKQIEKEQHELQSMLIQAQKMEVLGMLASGIAHDFNNILSAIMGYTELAYYQSQSHGTVRCKLEQVLKAGGQAKDIIGQILSFTRRAPHQRKIFALGLVVQEAVKLIRITIPLNIEIQVDVRSQALVEGDPTQIHQILLNLCTNAYHAMREKGGILTVALQETLLGTAIEDHGQVLPPGPFLKLTVGDTGHGIPPELRHRVFDPFFTSKPQGEGTGLGLSTVRGIVQEFGGLVTFESEIGKGTVFAVYLPRREALLPDDDRPSQEPPAAGEGHILLVDDEPQLADLVQEMLTSLGYQVTTRYNPFAALQLFEANPHDFAMVITDMAMPEMTGEGLAARILEIRTDVPVILCTGYDDQSLAGRADVLGIKKIIRKPFEMRELAEDIRTFLAKA
jgi:CHASE2 domain-containing sensor protein/signal transduction histidine kinase/CheY-like chemotaxis protein